jgi:5-methylcytosine-specific restriction endonuclease McrA
MNIVSPDSKTTLLLNNAWQPINTITARAAFTHLIKNNVVSLDQDSQLFHSFDTWNTLASFYEDQPCLRSAKSLWRIPTIMVVSTKFFSRPKKKKLSLVELARLHDNVCQYCLNRYPVSDLTIDHVHPRSKGGTDDHSNRVLACRPCNSRKGSKTPWFNVNGEVPAAPLIPAISSLILNKNKIRKEWQSFL